MCEVLSLCTIIRHPAHTTHHTPHTTQHTMCGRTRISFAPAQVEAATGVPRERWVDRDRYQPSHNVSPGAWTPILRLDQQQQAPMLQSMRWGLVPSFIKQGSPLDFFKMFNARSESVAEKFSFSRLLPSQRCVVLLEGFYEWKAESGGKKQPYYVSLGEGQVVRMAGLYDVYTGGEDGPLATYTILTTDTSPRLAWLHNRMPVLLQDDAAVQAWLHGQDGKAQVPPLKICGPCNSEALTWHPVTTAMSKPGYNKPDASVDVRKKKGAITSFFKASPVKQQQQQQQQQQKQQQKQQHSPASQSEQPGKREVDQQQQQEKEVHQQQAAVRNSDQEAGPTAADEAAAAAQVHAATPPADQPAAAAAAATPPADQPAAAAAATPPAGKPAGTAAAAAAAAAPAAAAAVRAASNKRGAPEPAGVIDLTAEDEPAAAAADTAPAGSRQESPAKKPRTV